MKCETSVSLNIYLILYMTMTMLKIFYVEYTFIIIQ